jgi:dUTP pyrophosphatase
VRIILANLGSAAVTLTRGERVAQLVVAPVTRVAWAVTAELPETQRGAGGFGSTGT